MEVPRTDAGLRILQGREVRGPLLRDRASQCNAWRWTSFKVSRQDLHKAMAAATISSYGPCGFRPPACIDPFPLSLPLSRCLSLPLPRPCLRLELLGIACITAAAQSRWRNNVFKGIMLQLMASLGESLVHLACGRSASLGPPPTPPRAA